MIRHGFLAASVLAAAFAFSAPAGAVTFASSVEDLPIMDGLTETDAGFAFETARGRIVRVEASGPVAVEDALDFYRRTLPALGWRLQDSRAGVFERAGERLAVSIARDTGAQARVVFEISPASSGE